MDHRSKCKLQNYVTSGKNMRKNFSEFGFGNELLSATSKNMTYKRKKLMCDFTKLKNDCCMKNSKDNKNVSYRLGENIYKTLIQKNLQSKICRETL